MNVLIIKLSNGNSMTYFEQANAYDNYSEKAEALVSEHHPSLTMLACALADAEALQAAAPANIDSSLHVGAKSDAVLLGATIIPPHGVDVEDIDDLDSVAYVN